MNMQEPLRFERDMSAAKESIYMRGRVFKSARSRRDQIIGSILIFMLRQHFSMAQADDQMGEIRPIFMVSDRTEPALIMRYVSAAHAATWLEYVATDVASELSLMLTNSAREGDVSYDVFLSQIESTPVDHARLFLLALMNRGCTSNDVLSWNFDRFETILGFTFRDTPENRQLVALAQETIKRDRTTTTDHESFH